MLLLTHPPSPVLLLLSPHPPSPHLLLYTYTCNSQEARLEGEKEAEDRANDFANQKKEAAVKRREAGDKAREEGASRKVEAIEKAQKEVETKHAERVKHAALVEQQRQELLKVPPGGGVENHHRNLMRRAAAPIEARKLDGMREKRLVEAAAASDESVLENRRKTVKEHEKWVKTQRVKRGVVIRRVEATFVSHANKIEENRQSVRDYEAAMQKHEARKILRERIIAQEREAFRERQSEVEKAVRASEVGAEVISDDALMGVIGGGGGKKKR